MCGRFTRKTPVHEIAELFEVEADELPDLPARYNLAPTEPVLAVRRARRRDERQLVALRWGLVPNWAADPTSLPLMINARAESLEEKPAFRDSLRTRRCLVVADGFFEWRKEGGVKQPYFVRLRSGQPFAFAGLWDQWRGRRGEADVESCTIVTTEPNDLLEPLHNRMPAILSAEAEELWLDPTVETFAKLGPALRPYPSSDLELFAVSRRVNRVDHDDPECIEPIDRSISDPAELAAYRADPSADASGTAETGVGEEGPDQLELL